MYTCSLTVKGVKNNSKFFKKTIHRNVIETPCKETIAVNNNTTNQQNGHSFISDSAPKPIFKIKKSKSKENTTRAEEITPQHKGQVEFFLDVWKKVEDECEYHRKNGIPGGPVLYSDDSPTKYEFTPLDFDRWRIETYLERS